MNKKQLKRMFPLSVQSIENIVEKGVNPQTISELKWYWQNESRKLNTIKLAK